MLANVAAAAAAADDDDDAVDMADMGGKVLTPTLPGTSTSMPSIMSS